MRGRLIAAGFVFGAMLIAPAAHAATTTIGQVAPPGAPDGMCSQCSSFQIQTGPTAPSYVVPPTPAGGGWTITSWQTRGGSLNDIARLQVWRPTPMASVLQLVATTSDTTIVGGAADPNPVSIPVQPGDVLGLRMGPGARIPRFHAGGAMDSAATVIGDPAVGETADTAAAMGTYQTATTNTVRVNVAAVLTAPDPPLAQNQPPGASPPVKKKKCKRKRNRAAAAKKRCGKKKK